MGDDDQGTDGTLAVARPDDVDGADCNHSDRDFAHTSDVVVAQCSNDGVPEDQVAHAMTVGHQRVHAFLRDA